MADVASTHVNLLRSVDVKRPNAVLQGMARHPYLCIFAFALVFTIIANYGDSFSQKPVIQAPRQPQFLFPPHLSVVIDSSRGSLEPVVKRLQKDEFVFVMFYAPWCSKSLAARAEFEKAAVLLHNKVTFAAVNCWWPEGECSKRYKFLVFPAFLAYHTSLDGYRYTGAFRADHFIKFVENLIHPLSLVHTSQDIENIIARNDAVALGFFNLTGNDHIGSYRQFYYASMRILEKDPLQPVHFAVSTNFSLGGIFKLSENGIILIQAKNVSVIYPLVNNITSSNLVNWVLQNKGRPAVSRLYSSGLKSQSLATNIDKGPAVIVFHHEDPLFKVEQGLHVLKDVALQYQTCLLEKGFKGLHSTWRRLASVEKKKFRKLSGLCQTLRRSHYLLKKSFPCCYTAVVKKLREKWHVCEVCQVDGQQRCSVSFRSIIEALSRNVLSISNCSTIAPSYQHVKHYNMCCQNQSDYASQDVKGIFDKRNHQDDFKSLLSDLPQESFFYQDLNDRRLTDRYYLENFERLPRRLCDRFSYAKLNSPIFPNLEEESVYSIDPYLARELKAIGCRTNQSLNFFSMDSQSHWMFIDRLGIGRKISTLSPSIVIFDKEAEEHYIMKENFTFSNTMSFIMDFQKGNLKRQRNSDSFEMTGCGIDGQVCVQELNSKTFLSSVKTEYKDVVVLIYSHWCGFCKSLSHTFLTLAQYFGTSKYISFVRINGATNDLPWEYTVESYPQILFFPAHRKPDSVMFPSNKDKTLINLIHFFLKHSTYDTRLLLASDVCSKSCIEKNLSQSKGLLQKLTWKYKKALISINSIAHLLLDVSKSNTYLRLSYEFIRKRLNNFSERIKNIRLLIRYLENNKDGRIDQSKLMTLFQDDQKEK